MKSQKIVDLLRQKDLDDHKYRKRY